MIAQEEALALLKELIDGTTDVRQGAIYAEELDLNVWIDKAKSIVRGGTRWQPIETAPTDGKRFLAVNIFDEICFGCYDDCEDNYIDPETYHSGLKCWMPLPDIPSSQKG